MNTNHRQEQGQAIAQIKNAVKRINEIIYIVNSQITLADLIDIKVKK